MNKTLIRKVLLESLFDPREPGPFSVLLDHTLSNCQYYEHRAIEFIKDAPQAGGVEGYQQFLTKAITLLALAKIRMKEGESGGPVQNKAYTKRRSRKQNTKRDNRHAEESGVARTDHARESVPIRVS